jgi:hypothetical protein
MEDSRKSSRDLDDILPDDAPEELCKWWDRVLMTAKEFCKDPQGTLINYDVLVARKSDNKWEDVEKAKECMRRAIEHHLKSMPIITGGVFMQIIRNLSSQK